mmetsp:Transcript_22954/g.39366  ORF Transcript_22954/g.39366 Transcript_22954/m.39366 type:complete len:207 (+) Transcript_22954:217-837(+)|eukprot:CAMPEP_0196665620 /NCGR_PEP_ID=MMETSP1086-20130531/61858_1 /TAXON_ID=77921 /ORGANISM="Cyanoptyche  gloeocystis , Strain SAG4.97" /LENGTH=206 /DNA_ID=CAMNT_0042002473 /DNA_START=215 /DNA_END=835 /DNA_ORIENTATION=-
MAGRGALIVFEGIDRCGKSTQSKLLVDRLKQDGVNANLLRFPDRTTQIGQMINKYLTNASTVDDRSIHLLFSANRWELADSIQQRLAEGETLVVDRYAYSGVAFSVAKGLDIAWCKSPDEGLPAADTVLYLTLDPHQAAERGQYGEERYERLDFQVRVAAAYDSLRSPNWQLFDARQSIESLAAQLHTAVTDTIRQVADQPLQRLW